MSERAERKKHAVAKTAVSAALVVGLSTTAVPAAVMISLDGGDFALAAPSPEDQALVPSDSTASFEKSEVVYASLAGDGSPQALYVVNQFDVSKAGALVDFGPYREVRSLTRELGLTLQGDAVSFDAPKGSFSYQGDASPDRLVLPWAVSLEYALDGQPVSADQLGGATGDLEIRLKTSRNEGVNPAFAESFMLQATFTLDGESCTDVRAEGATIAAAGSDCTVAFTVLPGHDGDFTLRAHVEGFSMAGLQIAALPYSSVIEMPEVGDVESDFTALSDAVDKLNEGARQLSSGVGDLSRGARTLADGASSFGDGLEQLDGSSSSLVNASLQVDGALQTLAQQLANADFSQFDQLAALPPALLQMADALDQLAAAAAAADEGYNSALSALDAALQGLLASAPTDAEIASLKASVAGTEQEATVDKLLGVHAAAQATKATYDATAPAFSGAHATLGATSSALVPQAEALRSLAESLSAAADANVSGQLAELAAGISQLSDQYGQFHEGLAAYAGGVSTLADNFGQLESGVRSLADGTGQTASGAKSLSGGVGELAEGTRNLPSQMRERMDDLMADYEFPEFDPVSFVSPSGNEQVTAVQFVMTTPAIEAPEPEPQPEEEAAEPTVWDRFLDLFR